MSKSHIMFLQLKYLQNRLHILMNFNIFVVGRSLRYSYELSITLTTIQHRLTNDF